MIQVFIPKYEIPVIGSFWRFRTNVWGVPAYNVVQVRDYSADRKRVYYVNMVNMFGTLADQLDVFHSIFVRIE
jgi:hypothetical protein